MAQSRTRALTVIELLVITSTLTILAAILFPVFAQARERARQVGCASNLRQLSAAMRLYSDENDSAFPVAFPSMKR